MAGAASYDGTPMLVICGLYQLFGKFFKTRLGSVLPGIGILDVETETASEHWAVGGEPGRVAPYFTVIVLEGRPAEQRRRLLGALTDIVVDVLGVDRRDVRGRIIQVAPDDWGIGGVPASAARRDEIAARSTP